MQSKIIIFILAANYGTRFAMIITEAFAIIIIGNMYNNNARLIHPACTKDFPEAFAEASYNLPYNI